MFFIAPKNAPGNFGGQFLNTMTTCEDMDLIDFFGNIVKKLQINWPDYLE